MVQGLPEEYTQHKMHIQKEDKALQEAFNKMETRESYRRIVGHIPRKERDNTICTGSLAMVIATLAIAIAIGTLEVVRVAIAIGTFAITRATLAMAIATIIIAIAIATLVISIAKLAIETLAIEKPALINDS